MGTTKSKSAGTATAQSDQTAGLSFQRRDILNQRKLLDEFEQNRKDDGYSQAAIEKERQRLDFLENSEDIRELLDSSFVKFQENLKAMKTASDALKVIDSLPGEVTTFFRAIDDACTDGDDTERALSNFKIQANVFLNKNLAFQMKANELPVEDLKVQSDELIRELNKLGDLNKAVLLCCTKMEEKVSKLNLDTLKSSLQNSRKQLKRKQWKLLGLGIGASILAISGIGIVVRVGVLLSKSAPKSKKLHADSAAESTKIKQTFMKYAKADVAKLISEVSTNRQDLNSMEQCLEVLSGLKAFELSSDQFKMVLESTLSEAKKIRKQTVCRLKEAERMIKTEQQITELQQLVRERGLKEAERTIKSDQKITNLEQSLREMGQLLREKEQEYETLKRAQTESSNPVNPV